MKLSVQKIKSMTKPGLYGDGGTLYLRVAPGGSKSFIQRIVINGRRHDIGLGGWPLTTLAEARDMAFDNRRKARRGSDPLAEKRKVVKPTFCQAAAATYEKEKAGWRSEKTGKIWLSEMERRVFPKIGDKPVDKVGRQDVLDILIPIYAGSPEMGRKMRARIRTVLAWAEANGHVDRNMAGEAIKGGIPKTRGSLSHFRSLPHGDVGEALTIIAESTAGPSAKHCLTFTVLTACRSGEARAAVWDEIDLEAATWIIPADKMKTGKEHRVPLSEAALAVLDQAAKLREKGSDLVFPSPRGGGKALSDMTLTKLMRTCGLADRATVHGFRSSFRDWCAETGKPREIAEAALAHAVHGVEGAYFRSDLFDRRRTLMEQWGGYLTGHDAKVVKLRKYT